MTTTPPLSPERRSRLSLPERADIALLRRLEPAIRSGWGYWTGKLGNLADEPPLRALSGACLAAGLLGRRPRLRRAGIRMLVGHSLATAAKTLGKNNIDRSRPMALLDEDRYRMARGQSRDEALRSFPSGHTAGAVAVACGFAREYPHARFVALSTAASLGVLQIFRRAHFPGDVLAGAFVGLSASRAADAVLAPVLENGSAAS